MSAKRLLLEHRLHLRAQPLELLSQSSTQNTESRAAQDALRQAQNPSGQNSSGKETVAPNGPYSTAKGNVIYAVDGPGPHSAVGRGVVDSVTTNIQFKSWIVDAKGKQVSPAVNWSVRIVVVGGQLKTATAGVE